MAFTTLVNLVNKCAALQLEHVKTPTGYRPRRLAAGQLPLLFTRLPNASRQISTLTYGQGLKHATIEIVIVVQMVQLDTQETNDALSVTLMDELTAELETNADDLGMDSYSITNDIDSVDNGLTVSQNIIATVEVSG